MSEHNVSRRRLLRGTAAGATATGVVHTAAAQGPPERKIIGLTADAPPGLARQSAEEIHHELDFDRIGKAIVGNFPEEAIDGLENNPNVRYVEDDQRATALQTTPWGVDRVGGDLVHDAGETGSGGSIAIVDTGVQVDHESLDVAGGEAFGTTCTTCQEPYGDDNGHGTHCAGTAVAPDNETGVVGVSLQSELYAVKVLDSQGGGDFGDVAAGVEWAADQGIDVVSLSLGGSIPVQALEDACQYAVDQGSLVVAAAGNDGCLTASATLRRTTPSSPSRRRTRATISRVSPRAASRSTSPHPAATSTRRTPAATTTLSRGRRWRVPTSPAPQRT